ncbi:DUF4902 domain-containing protein [Methylobacter psychrophilus]|uniref:DUF4902 domain-containing protein n=1 Tax=Methylobacter psychrophilus TaxID=96941 RepID=UPI0021D5012F|nr:DUF4902 domain-containing protein [Methylobacter psychrophilus]
MRNNNLILNKGHQPFTPILSTDGYIRLTLAQLTCLQLHHLHSNLYTEHILNVCSATSLTEIKGYTEWVSQSQPSISVGWDWLVDYRIGATDYSMDGQPFSNILLRNNQQHDLSEEESLTIIGLWLNTLNWQEEIFNYIQSKYS